MNAPCIRTVENRPHIAKVIAARRALCVGEGFRVTPNTKAYPHG